MTCLLKLNKHVDIFNQSLLKFQTFNRCMYTVSIIYVIAGLLVSVGINSMHVPRHFMEVFPKDGYRSGKFQIWPVSE